MFAIFPIMVLAFALLDPAATHRIAPLSIPSYGSNVTETRAAVGAGPILALVSSSQALPQRTPEPRTLHAFWPVFAGFALTWIGIMVYLLSFTGRLKRLEDAMNQDHIPDQER